MISSCVWADTECFVVTRLGYRWALTLAPPYVQLIWTLTGCQTCWSEHLCFLRSEMRVKLQSISTEETWVCTGDDLVRDEGVGPGRVMSFQHRNSMSQIVGLWLSLAEREVTENSSVIMVSQTPAHIHHRAVNLLRRSGKFSGFMLKLVVFVALC